MLIAAAPATAQERAQRVLVMPFAVEVEPGARGGASAALWLAEAAPTLLVEGLSTRGVEAISRGERVAAFAELHIPMSSALTRATTLRVGEIIGATDVVFGEIRLGSRMHVNARLVRLAAGVEAAAIDRDGAIEDIFEVFADVSTGLASEFDSATPPEAAPSPMALETFETYLKGLVAPGIEARQRFLEAAIREAPEDPRILMALWEVYTMLGLDDRALASANAVDDTSWMYRRARFAVALSMIELGRFEGARATLTAINAEQPSAGVLDLLGVVQLRQEQFVGPDGAAGYFHQATIEGPGNSDHLFNLGYAYARAGQSDEALTWLRETVRVEAADGDAHRVMSAVLASLGRTTEAQRELELAQLLGSSGEAAVPAALSSTVPEGLERMPDLADLSTTAASRQALPSPAQRDQEATARFHLANARRLLAEEREREAEEELRRAIYLAPNEEEPHRMIGGIHLRAGRLNDAIEAFTVALWCQETAAGRVGLARALLDSGRADDARREAQRALVLEPASVEAREIYNAASQ